MQRTDTPVPDSGVGTLCSRGSESSSEYQIQDTDAQQLTEDEAILRDSTAAAKQLLIECVQGGQHINDFTITTLIGFGAFGVVVKAFDAFTGKCVAIKIMRKELIDVNRIVVDPETNLKVPLEIALLKHCPKSPFVIDYVEFWDDKNCFYLVTACAGYGWNCDYDSDSLYSRQNVIDTVVIEGHNGSVVQTIDIPAQCNDHSLAGLLKCYGAFSYHSEDVIHFGQPVVPAIAQKKIMRQLCEALLTLHSHGIAHGDVKDENVLVDQEYCVRLVDFGHAHMFKNFKTGKFMYAKEYGTMLFAPPEYRSGMEFLGSKADVYAAGLMLFEMHAGDVPDDLEIVRYTKNGKSTFEMSFRNGFFTEEGRNLCSRMLARDPTLRLDMAEVLKHPWFD